MPAKQPKRKRLWLNDGPCVRLRPVDKDHVWSDDFVHAVTHDDRPLRMLTLIDDARAGRSIGPAPAKSDSSKSLKRR